MQTASLGPRQTHTLKRHETSPFQHLQDYLARGSLLAGVPLLDLLLEPRKIFRSSSRVGDDIIFIVGMLGDDSVVDDATLVIQKNRQCRMKWLQI